MQRFKDSAGRTWSIEINVGTVLRVRDLVEYDLLKIVEDSEAVRKLADDPVTLVNVAYAICEPQATRAGVSDEDFGKAMVGDVLGHAWDAVITELISFFPSRRRRPLMKAAALAGIAAAMTEAKQMEALGSLPPSAGGNCSRWRVGSALSRGCSRLLNCGRWMRHAMSK